MTIETGGDGPSSRGVRGPARLGGDGGLTAMGIHECWQRLANEPLGRLSICLAGRPHLVPVNHLVRDREIAFVSVAGTKSHAPLEQPGLPAAFEVDHYDNASRAAWSVVVHGELAVVDDEVEQARLELRGRPIWINGVHHRRWMLLVPEHVTGRHLPASDVRT